MNSFIEGMPTEENCILKMVDVGVTAKLPSPDYRTSVNIQSSSTDTETTLLRGRYRHFVNNCTSSERILQNAESGDSKTLYQLKTIDEYGFQKVTPARIEFSLYRKTQRHPRPRSSLSKHIRPKTSHSSMKRLIESESKSENQKHSPRPETSLFGKLKKSVRKLNKNQTQKKKHKLPQADLKTPTVYVDIYPFDHGCAEYLRATDCAPQIISELLAQRATDYATRFWAEFFGSLHIGVAFFMTFFIQAYRFLLYSVVKSFIVGFLQMTSDYGIKPILTVIFNGFLQPVLIFAHNILSSVRDVLLPMSETITHFLKPIGGVLRSIRLASVKVNGSRGMVKDA